ncbi:MAG TPA: adenylyltransferase/cytidyltransferase family protein [Luteimonas sp.]|nr:adenylyltransferase/cytidyltransferase family protein [Luteimonas sp.]
MRVITFGTFDLLHEGHLRLLQRARELGDHLIVGVSTDRLNAEKGKRSFFSQEQRAKCVAALKYVDEVFLEDALELKDEYIKQHHADLLVMGDDWEGKFDWVSCQVRYLSRTPGVSSTDAKLSIGEMFRCKKVLFGDTYVKKHYDCALSLINRMTAANMAPIITTGKSLPPGIDCDCIVYFNRPANPPPAEYESKPRLVIDHGASNLKWFLANRARYDFFDWIVTAGPAHAQSLLAFFAEEKEANSKVRSAGFIKSELLLAPPTTTREEIAARFSLDPAKPIVLFAPTWHITNNRDMAAAIANVAGIENHVAALHPETANLDTTGLNLVENINGITSELLKHADCIVSDTSSTIFEAAALGKPVVQVGLREYSDNNAILFDFPYVAGTAELFCGGLYARPDAVADTVRRALGGDPHVDLAMKAMRDRILAGTHIRADSGDAIVAEIGRACDLPRPEQAAIEGQAALRDLNLSRVHENLFFARNRLIAHAAGNIGTHHASNSEDAIAAALGAVDVVELDIVRAKDGLIVAHDGYESKYGLSKPFAETTVGEFLDARFGGELKPISLERAVDACTKKGKALVCDIKATGEEYRRVADELFELATGKGVLDRIVLQCYSNADFDYAARKGFRRTLLAVWKYFYKNPVGEGARDFIRHCLAVNEHIVIGISIPYINHHLDRPSYEYPEFLEFFSFWKRLYIHGAPLAKYPEIMRRNLGLFADAYSEQYQFGAPLGDFRWVDYLFLNPGLVEAGCDNQISATVHYLKYGRAEGRSTRCTVPNDFNYMEYLDLNPALRRAGISAANSARAHWSAYGSNEGRRYKRSEIA